MTTTTTHADRAAGALLGLACGDAAGVPYEFTSAPYDPQRGPEMIGGGLGPYAPGEWSDDTQMALCIARVAASDTPIDSEEGLDAIARGFLDWLREGATDVGTQTRQVLGALRADDDGPGIGARMTALAAELHARSGRTAGNGALMRTAPVALAFLEDPERTAGAARMIAELTHADPLAGDSCVLWCEAIRRTIVDGEQARPEDGFGLLPPERRSAWAALADGTWREAALAPNGFTVTALYAALRSIERASPARDSAFRTGIAAAVALGDDTDTIAAITGSLLGAWTGAEEIPQEWTDVVHGWPGYDGRQVAALAEKILGR